MRKLVTLKTIDDITPIEGADRIETAHIGGWTIVVGKGDYYVGQKVFYFEPDAMLPLERNYFSFLRPRGVTTRDGKEYHRLKTAKLRGQISQGIIFPQSIFDINWKAGWDEEAGFPRSKDGESAYYDPDDALDAMVDIRENHDGDFSEWFGVIKYEPVLPSEIKDKMLPFPEWINKTDEERIQNLEPETLETILKDKENCIATEKIDGTSTTFFGKRDGDKMTFGVCSRNYEIIEDPTNIAWQKMDEKFISNGETTISPREFIASVLTNHETCVLQGELYGEKIQKNPLGIVGTKIAFFNLYIDGEFIPLSKISDEYEYLLPYWVPIHNVELPDNMEDIIKQPDGVYSLARGAAKQRQIEGFVWRHSTKETIANNKIDLSKVPEENRETIANSKACQPIRASFKAISNKYLLKHED